MFFGKNQSDKNQPPINRYSSGSQGVIVSDSALFPGYQDRIRDPIKILLLTVIVLDSSLQRGRFHPAKLLLFLCFLLKVVKIHASSNSSFIYSQKNHIYKCTKFTKFPPITSRIKIFTKNSHDHFNLNYIWEKIKLIPIKTIYLQFYVSNLSLFINSCVCTLFHRWRSLELIT